MGDDDPFEPAVLVVACEGAAALHLQHETSEIIGRVNAFLGFSAIGRIRIVQKPVTRVSHKPKPAPRALSPDEKARLQNSRQDRRRRLAALRWSGWERPS